MVGNKLLILFFANKLFLLIVESVFLLVAWGSAASSRKFNIVVTT